jgi:hypothetical protein
MPSTTPADQMPEPSPAQQALAAVLQPLARLMIDHGVQHAEVAELLKQLLVQESVARYGVADRGVSDTRVALLTGVHRKDVRRLRASAGAPKKPKAAMPVPSAVVARWISDPRFLNIDQSPRALARTPKAGTAGEPDFAALVAEVSRDVSARAVLDELTRLGAVELLPQGQVALVDQAFVPQGSPRELFDFLGGNVGDHLSAATHNLTPQNPVAPMLDQSAFSQDLSAQQVQELHRHARQLWAGVLQKFLAAATMAEQRSQSAPEHNHRVRLGVYFYEQDQGQPSVAAPQPTPRKRTRKGPAP